MSFEDSQMGNAQAIIEEVRACGSAAGRVHHVELEDRGVQHTYPVVRVRNGDTDQIQVFHDLINLHDQRAGGPRRRQTTHTMLELGAFCDLVNRLKVPDSAVYADPSNFSIVCVVNDHGVNREVHGWRDHRVAYQCPRSTEWQEWTKLDGRDMDQDSFADFIEAHLEHLTAAKGYPAPSEILQMARDLVVLTKGTFKRSLNPTTGAAILECKTDTDTGSTVIPRAFAIAIPVFEAGDHYQVECRIRFKLIEGQPRFSYQMHRRTETEREAFGGARALVQAETGLPLFAGRP